LFAVVKAYLTDKTVISLVNLTNLDWLWKYKFYLILSVTIGILYLGTSLFLTQFATNMGEGKSTVIFTFLVSTIYGSLFIPVYLYVANVWRKESIPPLHDVFWIYLGILIIGGIILAFVGWRTLLRLEAII